MGTWLRIGLRNLAKNRRRSLSTITAVALGFSAVNVFGGFTAYVFQGLADSHIYAQGNGHLTVQRRVPAGKGSLDLPESLMSAAEIAAVSDACLKDPRVVMVSPQLYVSGLVSNGRTSAVFIGLGKVPSDYVAMRRRSRSFVSRLKLFDGRELEDDRIEGVGMGRDLAAKLGLRLGSDAVVMASTAQGQVNAMDVTVRLLFDAPGEVLNDKAMLVPLSFARELYDTDGADRLSILLRRTSDTTAAGAGLEKALSGMGLELEVRPWNETAPSYEKTRNMFNLIFGFLFAIVVVIVVLSVVNTIGMAVMERTREIGTLRTLGLRRRGVVAVFAAESSLLGILGSVAGLGLTLAVWGVFKAARPTWIPPNFTIRVPMEVHLVPAYLLASLFLLVLLAVAGACLPARRASRMNIPDALAHV